MRLNDKVAVITGAGDGIGRACAKMFAKEGAKVVVAARRLHKLQETVDEIQSAGGEALAVATDVSKTCK